MLTWAVKTAKSRLIRANFSNGIQGGDLLKPSGKKAVPRKIGDLTKLSGEKDKQGGFLGFLWNGANAFLGFVGGLIKGIAFSATAIWSWVLSGINRLKQFNWNASDEDLRRLTQNQNIQLASVWGSFVGAGIGWMAGIAVGAGVSFLCPVIGGAALAKQVAGAVAREAADELLGELMAAVRTTVRVLTTRALINGYIGYRNLLKRAPRGLLERIWGKDTADFIKYTWGNEGGPNLSFNYQMDEFVDSIKNDTLQAFVEEMFEEAWDAFAEAGFVIASEIDDAYTASRLQNEQLLGPDRETVIYPDNEAPDEAIPMPPLPQREAQTAIVSTLNTQRLIHNRDVGAMIATPLDEYIAAQPHTLRLLIHLKSEKQPPWRPRNGRTRVQRVTIAIPDVERAKLDWLRIKQACGGPNGYMYGRYAARAKLSNGRQMTIYGATPQEAEERLNAFLQLSSAEIKTLNITEEAKVGERRTKPQLYKEPIRVYPAYFTVMNREAALDPNRSKASKHQRYVDKRGRILLWPEREPAGTEEKINFLLRRSAP